MNKSIFNECFYKAYGYHSCPTGDPELQKFFECVVKDVIESAWDEALHWMDLDEARRSMENLMEHYGIEE